MSVYKVEYLKNKSIHCAYPRWRTLKNAWYVSLEFAKGYVTAMQALKDPCPALRIIDIETGNVVQEDLENH